MDDPVLFLPCTMGGGSDFINLQKWNGQGVVAHTCNPSSQEAEAGGFHIEGSQGYIKIMGWGPS